MTLDINTLLLVTVMNIVVLALISSAVMGTQLEAAANAARWSLVVHAAAWVCMIVANLWPETLADRTLSTLSLAGFCGTHWLMFKALQGWLGRRRFGRAITALAWLAPLGYFLLFGSYPWRVGWANFLLVAQLLLLTTACFAPSTSLRGRWRYVVAGSLITMAVLTLGRGVLGAFTDLYPSFLTPHPWNIAAMLMTNIVPLMINFAILGGWHEEAESALHRQAVTDALTGLLNRRGWQEVAQPLVANAKRHQLPMALLMVDIDYFKNINDTYGHEAGDRALQALSRLLGEASRASDVAARVGGEEFCLLLPGNDAPTAQLLDQRLRQQLPAMARALGFPLNFSTGLATLQPGETLERLMIRADMALYAAKGAGRGQLQIAAAQRDGEQP
ncbi:MAG: GGDEF domain-containing protein [Rhodoferax sp.]|uniref:GGDEF domain-containing protein n=1 Tax=Rhodoferax sp. TaxID=50421 RepID=UPI001B3F9E49|nr:GGDEF domain-containing protein [Rhodoferax sp.]MBP9905465.1 GGDEF domain-containing protein [Rhodoferax sp.]